MFREFAHRVTRTMRSGYFTSSGVTTVGASPSIAAQLGKRPAMIQPRTVARRPLGKVSLYRPNSRTPTILASWCGSRAIMSHNRVASDIRDSYAKQAGHGPACLH